MALDDSSIRALVLSRPIPERLIRDIGRARELPTHERFYAMKHYEDTSRLRMTPVHYETLKLAAFGLTNRQIADELGISFYAAQERMKYLLAFFDTKNRTTLAAKLYRERIV